MSEQPAHDTEGKKPSFRYLFVIGIIALVVFLFLFYHSHQKRKHEEEEAKKASAFHPPVVRVVKPHRGSDTTTLMLPGNLQGIRETSLYARVPGFVKNWYVDIGDKVTEGQLLAEIETPELDQQLDQAKASMDLAKTSLDRVNSVTIEGAVSIQQKADREGAYKTSLAQFNQLQAQKSFKRVVAPFTGVITSRNIDIGTLINAGSTASQQLFTIAQTNQLRIFVNVPQTFVQNINVGTPAKIIVQELAGHVVIGKVTRTAGALNPDTRTLTTQVNFDNPDHLYFPGMYANVKFDVRRPAPVVIPASTLVIHTEGPQVVSVLPDSTLAILNVSISRDNGATIELQSGLNGNESLVTNPSLNLTQGMKVSVAKPSKPKSAQNNGGTNKPGEPENSSEKKSSPDSAHHKK